MEARFIRPLLGLATVLLLGSATNAVAQLPGRQGEYVAHSQNFIVFASGQAWAEQVAQVAEQHRRELAIYWLGAELPPWSQRCPIHVQSSPQLGAGGETRFSLMSGTAGNWAMSVQGTQERVLDSVLPHEITHTIFATHFAPLDKYVPRWADEGACTTVEHEAEKRKHRHYLQEFLKTGRGLSFNNMFSLKEYPNDILPLYAQGHSAVQFLLDQGGPHKFIQFITTGMQSDAWEPALRDVYAYRSLGEFQTMWNKWLADGSPAELISYSPSLQQNATPTNLALASSSPLLDSRPSRNLHLEPGSSGAASVVLVSEQYLASQIREQQPGRLPTDPPALTDRPAGVPAAAVALGNESWYKRRLREVSGSPATPVPEHNIVAKSTLRNQPQARLSTSGYPGSLGSPAQNHSQASSRPMPPQSPGIQVLEWGSSSGPVPGVAQPGFYSRSPAMVPLLR